MTDSATHTAGPWIIEDTNSAKQSLIVKSVHVGSNGSTVCIGQIAGPDRILNARLIAAAPELLEALKRLTIDCKIARLDKQAGFDCWISMADEAISKAEGRQDD